MVEELKRFPLLRRAGAFSVNKKSAQASMEAIKYAVNVLGDLGNNLYLFPQGIIKPPNARPIEFRSGLAYIAEKAAQKYGKVALMPIAVNYFFLRDNRPEVLVEMGELIELQAGKIDRKESIDVTFAAVVTQVLPNGNLVIEGTQEIRVSYEVRQLSMRGIIRRADLSSDNTIESSKIAELRVSYGGEGVISDVQQPRYGRQVIDIIAPF